MAKKHPGGYQPSFVITPQILTSCAEIMNHVGFLEGLRADAPQPQLRRRNSIRTVQSTLTIEGNTLSVDQITAFLQGQRVLGSVREIREVTQALAVYKSIKKYAGTSERDFLSAHKALMSNLMNEAGVYRSGGVGVMRGREVAHVAPPASRVPALMAQLFGWLSQATSLPSVVRSSVFHYELEFIYPFSDGNGRMGRLWQHVVLVRDHPIFEHVPFESIIATRQRTYYDVLGACDEAADCTKFIEFCSAAILDAVKEYRNEVRPVAQNCQERLDRAQFYFKSRVFSRLEYLGVFKQISTATASRDLRSGVEKRRLQASGQGNLTRYLFVV